MRFIEYLEVLRESNSKEMLKIKEEFKDELEKFNVYEYNDKISIDLIVVKNKNSGIGSKIMKRIIDIADKQSKICVLSPSNEFGGTISRLITFYKKFGFIENKGKNKIFGIFEKMYREPK